MSTPARKSLWDIVNKDSLKMKPQLLVTVDEPMFIRNQDGKLVFNPRYKGGRKRNKVKLNPDDPTKVILCPVLNPGDERKTPRKQFWEDRPKLKKKVEECKQQIKDAVLAALRKRVEAERKKKRKTVTIPADFGSPDAVFPRVGESYEFRLNEAKNILMLINNHHREHAAKIMDTVKRVQLDYSLRNDWRK